MPQTTVNIRIDEDLKRQAEMLFSEFGMNMTTAITIFIKAALRNGKIPFEISTNMEDFYNKYNQLILKKSIEQREKGEVVVKTFAELEQMADGK